MSRTSTYSVSVSAPDFGISVSPISGSVAQGGTKTTTVTVIPIAGFSSTVTLTYVSPVPFALTSLIPSSGTPPFSSVLSIRTNYMGTTPKGAYVITITGTGGGKTHTCIYTLTVT